MKRLNPFSPFSWKINIFWTAWLACVYVFMRNHKQVKQNAPILFSATVKYRANNDVYSLH